MVANTRPTNLQRLKPSRHIPRAGDWFLCRPANRGYLVGRVVNPNTKIGGFRDGGVVLLYIYAPLFQDSVLPPRDQLRPDNLLIPPLGTNRLPWSLGYFQHLERGPIRSDDVLPVHCFLEQFRDSELNIQRRYRNEFGEHLKEPVEPVGVWGLRSYLTIDDAISDALGLPRMVDESHPTKPGSPFGPVAGG